MSAIGVLGAGTWGMALARMLARSGHDVTVWSALPQELETLAATRRQKNLPGMVIPEEVHFEKELAKACQDKEIIVFAVPSPFVRSTAKAAREFIPDGQIVADVAKGLEAGTLLTLTEVIAEELKEDGAHEGVRLVALSGPTHAEEVALDLPTTIVSASKDKEARETVQAAFMNENMRVYTNTDVHGVELCGALKNIIALASGISRGLGYGDNAKAALITRGMAEITRLGLALGCERSTFGGLAGIGDLIVTATSEHSRNNRCGELIGKGVAPAEAVKQIGMVVEGMNAIPAALELSKKYGIEMPITFAVDAVVNHGADPRAAVAALMSRDKKAETE